MKSPAFSPLPSLLDRLPTRNSGRFRRPGDPWNLLLAGFESQLDRVLTDAGWVRLPRSAAASVGCGLRQLARRMPLTLFPPMNTYRLFGRAQDQNWALAVKPLSSRHHFRLWRLPWRDASGRPYWWGSANFDVRMRLWDLSHVPDPDVDAERDFIARSLASSRGVESLELVDPGRVPSEGVNDKGHRFFTDGKILQAVLN